MMLSENQKNTIERWVIYELELKGPASGNPFIDVNLKGVFTNQEKTLTVEGFYDGNGVYKIRFMPNALGTWRYITKSNNAALNGIEGEFVCIEPSHANHGQVRVRNTYHFAYEDGTPYYPIGTTCYAWQHQGNQLEEQTLQTLATAPFNKMRMCVFPKHYDYNHNEPEFYPFEGSSAQGWNFEKFNPAFFQHLELRIKNLMELGIEADLILFHPYDRWGFSTMDSKTDDRYLHYIVARLAAFKNIWWSLANEYDLMGKSLADWERFAQIIVENDPYQHLRSIHNCHHFYDHTRPWVTHCSIQRTDLYKSTELVNEWRDRFRKPVVVDECAYEGNINHGWGNIPGTEMVRRFWEGTVRGGYVGHGETYEDSREILWWSKGGTLHGQSPARIEFLKKILAEAPASGLDYFPFEWDLPCGGIAGEYYLCYFGCHQPIFRVFSLPEDKQYYVDIIDTWDMTISRVEGVHHGNFRIELPGKPYIAVRIQKV